jgi:hypothetical protein
MTSFFFSPNILLSILFPNTPSLCSSLNVRDQVSHPCRPIGKIIVLYILIFTFQQQARMKIKRKKQARRQKVLDRIMVVDMSRIQSIKELAGAPRQITVSHFLFHE